MPKSESPPGSPVYILVRPGVYDPCEFTLQEIMKVVLLIQDILIQYDDNFVVSGQVNKILENFEDMTHFNVFRSQSSIWQTLKWLICFNTASHF